MNKLILAAAAILSWGCAPEKQVDISLLTSARDDALVVEDDHIELTEGIAIGVRVDAVSNDETQADWGVRATSENGSIAYISETEDDRTFVIIGKRPGKTELRFELRGSDLVYVPITVHPRDSVDLHPLGGAPGK